MGKLTTHVLDTVAGIPAAGVRLRLSRDGRIVAEAVTNADGRCDDPLLFDAPPGDYQLVFEIGEYFRGRGMASDFLDQVPVQFRVTAGRNHHVPLACSPYAYSTYRGS